MKQIDYAKFDTAFNSLDMARFMLETLGTLIGCADNISALRPDALSMTLYQIQRQVEQAAEALS